MSDRQRVEIEVIKYFHNFSGVHELTEFLTYRWKHRFEQWFTIFDGAGAKTNSAGGLAFIGKKKYNNSKEKWANA